MTKQLYEEALADVKQVKEFAENNAKRAIIEAVTPRIKDLIERELLKEERDDEVDNDDLQANDSSQDKSSKTKNDDEENVLLDEVDTEPEDKVTLDLDAVKDDQAGSQVDSFGADEYELTKEGIDILQKITEQGSDLSRKIVELSERVNKYAGAPARFKVLESYQSNISQIIANVKDMYDYVQTEVSDQKLKGLYESGLEKQFEKLQELAEMGMNKKNRVDEGDVTLTLTGLPDDLDLDNVGVDLVTDEGDETDLDVDSDDDSAEMTSDDDESMESDDDVEVDFDSMGSDESEQGEGDQMEGMDLSDDTIVEIDEGMLRREIARMKALREHDHPASILDDFGGGEDDGDAFLEGEVTTESASADEMCEDDEEQEETDEMTSSGTSSTRATHEQFMPMERLQRKLALEKRLHASMRASAKSLKESMVNARARKNIKLSNHYRNQLMKVVSRINEANTRIEKLKGQLAEASMTKSRASSLNEARQNRASQRSAENTEDLRKKLAETNLLNTKLRYTNKLLQNDSLSVKQKAQVIKQLDEAKTDREAKLVYESLSNTFTSKEKLVEGAGERKVLGSSSRPTTPASTQVVNEGFGYDIDRMAKIAGINQK